MLTNLGELLKIRCEQNWLINEDNRDFFDYTNKVFQLFKSQEIIPKVLIIETDPKDYMANFLAAMMAGCPVFLGNPHWSDSELVKVLKLIEPQFIGGRLDFAPEDYYQRKAFHDLQNVAKPYIMIPTGGTSGEIKFAVHDLDSLLASVKNFLQYFELKSINSCCILPVYHVSGLMQFLRSFFSGGNFIFFDYNCLKNNVYPPINPKDFFISLVPKQLQFLLENNPQWLGKFKTVLLGGSPASTLLLETAREHKINLAITYGMTETASGIAILKPQDFLNGNNSSGQLLPNSEIDFIKKGIIRIYSNSNFINYYPLIDNRKTYVITDDLGYFDEDKFLHITGRNSRKIISGGENIFPEEIEKVILDTGLVSDIYIIGTPNDQWGEIVTAFFVPKNDKISEAKIHSKIKHKLTNYKIPKQWIEVKDIPRNKQGKVNLKLMQEKYINS